MEQSKIDLAVSSAQRIERILTDGFGAQGRGLHEKISSVETHLPSSLVKNLRWIATVRNKTVHEDKDAIKDRRDFIRASKEAEIDLLNLVEASRKGINNKEYGSGVFWIMFLGIMTILVAAVLLVP
ncbi:MAG: hypothetical protein PHT38_01025, partial [Halothiobacillus sp.]|nr:hypothetical protein [Halothiobacillus sp.]